MTALHIKPFTAENSCLGSYPSLSANWGVLFSYNKLSLWKPISTFFFPSNYRAQRTIRYHTQVWGGAPSSPPLLKGWMPLMYLRISFSAEFFWLLIDAPELWNISSALITTPSQGGLLSKRKYIVPITHLLKGGCVHTLIWETALERNWGKLVEGDSVSSDLLILLWQSAF